MPKINTAYTFDVALPSQADTRVFQTNPTLAVGDVKVSIDEGAFANLATLPVVTPAGSKNVKVTLSAAEMNGNRIIVLFSDAAGAEWCDTEIQIETSPDDLTVTNIADGFLARDLGSGTNAGTLNERTVRAALRWNRNESTIVGSTLTVFKEDGVTIAWSGTVTGALVTALGVDPA